MSSVEMYVFNQDGDAEHYADVKNAWRGAMAIWQLLEGKYLPSVPFPNWWDSSMGDYYSRMHPHNTNLRTEIWELVNSDKLTNEERIVLASTFDQVIVKKENILDLIKSFSVFDKLFEDKTNLLEHIKLLEEILNNDDVIAVGWNQTSVNGDTWADYNYDEEKDESTPYNILKQDEHWYLFD